MHSFRANFCVPTPLVSGNGDGFVEEAEEAFDRGGLVVVIEAGFAGRSRAQHIAAKCFLKG